MKRNYLLLLSIALLAVACGKIDLSEKEWSSIPEGPYLDFAVIKKVVIVDSLFFDGSGKRVEVEINPDVKERMLTYLKDFYYNRCDSLTISCLGKPIVKAILWPGIQSYIPKGLSIALDGDRLDSERPSFLVESCEDHSDCNLFIKQLKKTKIPITYTKHTPF